MGFLLPPSFWTCKIAGKNRVPWLLPVLSFPSTSDVTALHHLTASWGYWWYHTAAFSSSHGCIQTVRLDPVFIPSNPAFKASDRKSRRSNTAVNFEDLSS